MIWYTTRDAQNIGLKTQSRQKYIRNCLILYILCTPHGQFKALVNYSIDQKFIIHTFSCSSVCFHKLVNISSETYGLTPQFCWESEALHSFCRSSERRQSAKNTLYHHKLRNKRFRNKGQVKTLLPLSPCTGRGAGWHPWGVTTQRGRYPGEGVTSWPWVGWQARGLVFMCMT